MRKIKIVFRVFKKGVKKISADGFQNFYKGKSLFSLTVSAFRYGVKFGPNALARKLKQELISIDRRVDNKNLAFPNGLVTGVDPLHIQDWYTSYGKPVTIVIPSYNDLDVLIPCLDSLKATTDPKLCKILIIDDYCQEQQQKKLKKLEDDQVSIIFREKNGGFAKAVNTGLVRADKQLDVVLLNSDTIARPGWIEALQYGAYEFGVDTGIVGPKLLYPDGRIQSAGSYRNTEAPEWFDHYYRFQDANYGPANIPQYCLGVTGAAMYIKREFLEYVGLLDEKFPFAFEDMDWCLRGWEAGYRTLYFPAAELTHVESATRAKNKTLGPKEKESVRYFWEKWGDWFDKRNVLDKDGKLRIIFVLQTLGLSGGIKVVFEHATRLLNKGYAVEVWGLDMHDQYWSLPEGVRLRTFKNYERLIASLSNEEAIKIATWWETAFPVWLSSVRKGIPVYFIQEFETWFYPDDVIAQASVVSCYRKEFKNMTTSQYNKNEIESLGLRATAIPCGYDSNTYKTLPRVKRKENTLLALGRSFFQKNFTFTFKSWKNMGEKRPQMWLFGAEPEMAKLDRKITYYNKPSNEEANKLYNQATVFVQTSRHEGFSLPILEAMAAGCPVVCTDAHGNRDFCLADKNCLMVGHDDIAALTQAITKLFNDPSLRKRLSSAGLETVKQYTWDVVANRVADFYDNVAKQPDGDYIERIVRQYNTKAKQ